MALDPAAVSEANQRFWAAHPEKQGQLLTQNPEDAALREEWMKDYNAAKSGDAPPPSDATSDDKLDTAVKSCPLQNSPPPRRFLCVRTNVVKSDGGPGLASGHAMLSLHEGDNVTTYGAWPDSHPAIIRAGLANGDGSDIRTDFANDNISNFPYARCREIDEQQYQKLQQDIAKPFDWGYFNNCSKFASDTYSDVTGEKVDASDTFDIPTPRALGKYITDLNAGKNTNMNLPSGQN